MFLYANNYEENGDSLSFFDNVDDALKVFRAGNRMAKGTTTEYGLVGSYFANPFGPVIGITIRALTLSGFMKTDLSNSLKL